MRIVFPTSASTVDSETGIYIISALDIHPHASTTPSSSCPPAVNGPTCEELPINECDLYDGCYSEWGPCQSVFEGYRSPRGSLDQIPCNYTSQEIIYVEGRPASPCVAACIDPRKMLRDATCMLVPAGEYLEECGSGTSDRLVSCPAQEGFIYTKYNSCDGRFLTEVIGERIAMNSQLTLQAWLRCNTLPLSFRDASSSLGIMGLFEVVYLGLRTVNMEFVRLIFASDTHVAESENIQHVRTDWVHVAVQYDRESMFVRFVVNGTRLRTLTVRKFSTIVTPVTASQFREEVAEQLVTLVGRVHLGTFLLLREDLADPSPDVLTNLYLSQTSLPIELFGPTFTDSIVPIQHLNFLTRPPIGVTPSYPSCSGNVCGVDPDICLPSCANDSSFDSVSCICVEQLTSPIPQSVMRSEFTTTPAPFSVGEGFRTYAAESDQRLTGEAWIAGLVLTIVFIGTCWIVLRKCRRVRRVTDRSMRCTFENEPYCTDEPFADVTYDPVYSY